MAVLRLFAAAREAAGVTSAEILAPTVGEVVDEARRRYGERFSAVLATSKVWLNGEPARPEMPVTATDVVAILPPVSGGSAPARPPVVRGNLALVPELPPEPEEEPEAAVAPEVERPPLAVVHKATRPHGRLGLAWAAVTVALTVLGPTWLAGWLAVAAFIAGAQACLVWRKRGERPISLAAAALAAGLPLAASFDTGWMTALVVAGLAVTFVARLRAPTRAPSRDIALTLAVGVPVGLAAAAPVLVRHTGIAAALLLLAMVCIYDASAYLVGTGASSAWEGPAAGVAALIPVTIFAEVVLVPPFSGGEPLLLGVLAAVLAPAGPVAGSALLGDRAAHAPALRRLDSLLLVGPLWAWWAATFLQ
ncbi:MAG TPA: MoaD/ThiS family protein [Acidimicrobiales bacterium]|nr:MoaD/ThiS family protein [Acidimicrobiales bacterium]